MPIDSRIEEMNRQTSREADGVDAGSPVKLPGLLWRTIQQGLRLARCASLRGQQWQELTADTCEAFGRWVIVAKRWEQSLPSMGEAVGGDAERGTPPPARSQLGPTRPEGSGGGWELARTDGGVAQRQDPQQPHPQRERLTVLLITKNEERRIARCLASVAWADEIVVVDGQSTDATVALCRRAGATVILQPFSGSFAHERNAGLELATGDWVLQMDADELVTPQLRRAIERVLQTRDFRYGAYQARRRNIFLGRFMRYGGWYHEHLCVFRRAGHRYHGLVHERLEIHGLIGRLDADLQHEPFQSLEQFIARQNRYTTLQARELFEARGALPLPMVCRTLWQRPLNRFWKFYVKKQGFREGAHGLVFSMLFAWVDFLVWAKYCELAYGPEVSDTRQSSVAGVRHF